MGLLDGRAALVTGAAQGIGLEIARRFVAEGAAVLIADLEGGHAKAAADELSAVGRTAATACDVVLETDVGAAVRRCVEEFGSIDILVNNAGITRDASMRKMTLEDFRAVIDVHLQGAWIATKAAAEVMREQRRGAIINMSSISGKIGNFGQTNYSAAKAGLIGLTKASAREYARYGVRINAIQPGLIRTAMTAQMSPEVFAEKAAEIPLGRPGEPGEVASVALFLASDLSSYMTGSVVEVSGGRHM